MSGSIASSSEMQARKRPIPPAPAPAPPPPPPPPAASTSDGQMDPEVETQRRKDVWAVMLGVRVFNAVSVATFFQPDEYYQALEVAWQLAFGGDGRESGPWITWEWQHQLRSSLFPYTISLLYRGAAAISSLLGFPRPVEAQLLNMLPPLLMAVFAATMEYSTWRLSEKVYGKASVESWAVVSLLLLSPWQWFVSTRTLSNSVEASLTAAALCSWPWALFDVRATERERALNLSRFMYSLVLASVACVLRPTNALIWIVLGVYTIAKSTANETIALVRDAGIYGPIVLVLTGALDRLYYGVWVFPPAKWLHYNLTQNLAVFYGVSRSDYYVTEGLPILLTTVLPFALWGMFKSLTTFTWTPKGQKTVPTTANPAILRPLTAIVLTSVAALSAISHKEVRFIYPLLPALVLLAARPATAFFAPFPNPPNIWKKALLIGLLAINIALAAYVGFFHQRGVIDVSHYLRKEFETTNYDHLKVGEDAEAKSLTPLTVAFLMPCHSTPWRSHLVHKEIEAWALTCEPPINIEPEYRASYLDEADIFFADPPRWLRNNMAFESPVKPWDPAIARSRRIEAGPQGRRVWPQYLVMFERLVDDSETGQAVKHRLETNGYEECQRLWNSHWHDDWRRVGDVIVYCISGPGDAGSGRKTMWEPENKGWVFW